MSKKYPEFDENDPKTQERLAFLAKINQQTTDHCNSWSDLYSGLKEQISRYFASPDREKADFTVTLLLSFVLTLEDLPEEGDARVISQHMNEILVMHPERTGVMLFFGEEADDMRSKLAESHSRMPPALYSLLSLIQDGIEGAAVEDTSTPTKDKRTLH